MPKTSDNIFSEVDHLPNSAARTLFTYVGPILADFSWSFSLLKYHYLRLLILVYQLEAYRTPGWMNIAVIISLEGS